MARAGERRRRTGRSAAVGTSVVLHGAALLWLAWWTVPPRPATTTPEPPVLLLRLDASRSGVTVRPTTASTASIPPRVARPAVAAASPAPAPNAVARPTTQPLASGAVPGAGAMGGGLGEAASTGVRDTLRGLLGCAHADALDLTAAEKARCAERLGLASRTAPRVDPIPAEKRAYYDAVAAAYARARAPPSNAPPWLVDDRRTDLLADKGGFSIPFFACAMKFGAPRGWKSYHDVPPHALKLGKIGAIPCFIVPPSGRGLEESGVEAPASLRERTDDAAHMKALDPPATAPR